MGTDVHFWARMSVVLRRIEFALRTRSQRMYTDVHSLARLRYFFAVLLVSVLSICKGLRRCFFIIMNYELFCELLNTMFDAFDLGGLL